MSDDIQILKNRVTRNRGRSHSGGLLVLVGLVMEVAFAYIYRKGETHLETWGPIVADMFVAIGVWAEIHFAAQASHSEDELQRRSEEKIAEANAKAAEADARALEAKLELEKFKKPRSISVELRNQIAEQLKQFGPQEYAGRVAAGSDDGWDLWREISFALELAGWKRVGPFAPVGQPPYGPPATISYAAMPGIMIWFPGKGWFDIRPRAIALAKALRDGGEGVLAGHGPTSNNDNIIFIEIGPNPRLPASAYHGEE